MDDRSLPNSSLMTRHARARRAQRGIPMAAIEATLDHGREIRAGSGDIFLYLGRSEVQRAARAGVRLGDFEGTTLVVLQDGSLKTLWKAERPPRAACRRGLARRCRRSRR